MPGRAEQPTYKPISRKFTGKAMPQNRECIALVKLSRITEAGATFPKTLGLYRDCPEPKSG